MVTQVVDLAIFDGNKEYIRKLLLLFKPSAIETNRFKEDESYVTIYYKLENKAKAEALLKINEAGININEELESFSDIDTAIVGRKTAEVNE